MLSLTQEILEIQGRAAKVINWSLSYRRMYWDEANQEYTLEVTPITLEEGEVADIGDTVDSLDAQSLNEFQTGNITIFLNDKERQWSKANRNPSGKFKADTTATRGYKRKLTEFTLSVTYELEDGTESDPIVIFIGYGMSWNHDPETKTMEVTLVSRQIFLLRESAEKVSTLTAPDTALTGTVDGVNTVFTTPDKAVGRILDMRSGGALLREGLDYTTANMHDPDNFATITFAIAPTTTPTTQYRHWYVDQEIHTLVALLATQAGFAAGEQVISDVTFPNRVINRHSFTTQADFEGGLTAQNIDTVTIANQFTRKWHRIDTFADGDYTANPKWMTLDTSGVGHGIFSITGGKFRVAMDDSGGESGGVARVNLQDSGTGTLYPHWRLNYSNIQLRTFTFKANVTVPSGNVKVNQIFSLIGEGTGTGVYGIWFQSSDGHVHLVNTTTGASFIDCGAIGAGEHEYRVTIDANNDIEVFVDGVSAGTYNADNALTQNTVYLEVEVTTGGLANLVEIYLDDIYWSGSLDSAGTPTTDEAIFGSAVYDTLGDLVEYLTVLVTAQIPYGQSLVVETAVADESSPGSGTPGTFDAWTAVGSGGQIQSALKRFIKVRVRITDPGGEITTPGGLTANGNAACPIVFDVVVAYTTLRTRISVANFLNMSCESALKELTSLAGYERGISRANKLFFRARDEDTTPDFTIAMKDLVSPFSKVLDGDDRVWNRIVGQNGDYEQVVDCDTRGDSHPNSFDEHGVRQLSFGSSQIRLAKDADVVTGQGIAYYERFKNERERYLIELDFRPQIEPGDTAQLYVGDNLPEIPWFIGDTSRHLGETDIRLFGSAQQAAHAILAKVLTVRHSVKSKKTSLELEQILERATI